jgi:hypothetical protein
MDKKRRNILLICAAIFLVSYIARSFIVTALNMAYSQHQANRQRQVAGPKPAVSAAPAPDPAEPPLTNLSGVWESHGQVPSRGVCDLRLELKQNDPAHYAGFSRFSCISLAPPKDANVLANMLPHMNPDAAILTGTVEKGSIHFRADKTVGTDINGCAVTELTVTPFGASGVAAEWKEGTCQGGNLLMARQGQ